MPPKRRASRASKRTGAKAKEPAPQPEQTEEAASAEAEAVPMDTEPAAGATASKKTSAGRTSSSSGGVGKSARTHTRVAPGIQDIMQDPLTQLSIKNWAPGASEGFADALVQQVWQDELAGTNEVTSRVRLLDFSQYLQRYLWPNYSPESSSLQHTLSILRMTTGKRLDNEPVLQALLETGDADECQARFAGLVRAVVSLTLDHPNLGMCERELRVLFLAACFGSMEDARVRKVMSPLVSLEMWTGLVPAHRDALFRAMPTLAKRYNKLLSKVAEDDGKAGAKKKKKSTKAKTAGKRKAPDDSEASAGQMQSASQFWAQFLRDFHQGVKALPLTGPAPPSLLGFLERSIELIIDLLSQLRTRRFLHTYIAASHVLVACRASRSVQQRADADLLRHLLTRAVDMDHFEVNDFTGDALTPAQLAEAHADRVVALQRVVFARFSQRLSQLAFASVSGVPDVLTTSLQQLSDQELWEVAAALRLLPQPDASDTPSVLDYALADDLLSNREFHASVLEYHVAPRRTQLQVINATPMYPTETVLWDRSIVPDDAYSGERCLALPKLNLQFLTLHDYLLRSYQLYSLESTYGVRQDIETAVQRMRPARTTPDGPVVFHGWSKWALPIQRGGCRITQVAAPLLGQQHPRHVMADVTIDLSSLRRDDHKAAWDNLRQHDVVALLCVSPPSIALPPEQQTRLPFRQRFGVMHVRGGEVEAIKDHRGHSARDRDDAGRPVTLEGSMRTLRVKLDGAQYDQDGEGVYASLNLVMIRDGRQNNFKAVLQTIRQLMNSPTAVPDWLHDVFLGYGDPGAACYPALPEDALLSFDLGDALLDVQHARDAFPQCLVEVDDAAAAAAAASLFRVAFASAAASTEVGRRVQAAVFADATDTDVATGTSAGAEPKRKKAKIDVAEAPRVQVARYQGARHNSVRFAPMQVEAIRSGMNPGLTLIVGPPGTGKTDVAVQVVANLLRQFPRQRTLVITHSNHALNAMFEKLAALDVPGRYLLRLGHGADDLQLGSQDFSKRGRIDHMLQLRLHLLGMVERLAESLGLPGDVAYTCENAGFFFDLEVRPRWLEFWSAWSAGKADVAAFPFTAWYKQGSSSGQDDELAAAGVSREQVQQVLQMRWAFIEDMFAQLQECRSMELLRSWRDRGDFLLLKQARLIAMTCTHAAMKRQDLIDIGFRYDNLVMEEAGQVLEIETFVPILLQEPLDGVNALKRVVLLGDHNQLPPVVQNQAFQRYSHLDQSMFARLIRLGVPHVQLNLQGRARPSLARLYNWRYRALGDLPVVQQGEYLHAVAGMRFDYQFMDVPDYQGVGESEPTAHFTQNLGEAEAVVALYQLLRLLGHPAERISLLTTYRGQAALLHDVAEARCGGAQALRFGMPGAISTVDKYQGQQNDIVLLSLVRTKTVGHLRDVRRLVVAMSRARLGLYVFGRRDIWQNVYELSPTFRQLLARPSDALHLLLAERAPTQRLVEDEVPDEQVTCPESVEALGRLVIDKCRAS